MIARARRSAAFLGRKLLYAPVAHIGHVDEALVVHGDAAGEVRGVGQALGSGVPSGRGRMPGLRRAAEDRGGVDRPGFRVPVPRGCRPAVASATGVTGAAGSTARTGRLPLQVAQLPLDIGAKVLPTGPRFDADIEAAQKIRQLSFQRVQHLDIHSVSPSKTNDDNKLSLKELSVILAKI